MAPPTPTAAPPTEPPAEPPAEGEEPPTPEAPPAAQQWTQEDIDALAKFKAWMESETIPEEFLSKMVPLKNGDDIEYEPYEEVREGRMRLRDYHRSMGELKKEREQFNARAQAYESHFASIFDDGEDGMVGARNMHEIYTRQGKRKQLMQLGAILAKEEQEDIDTARGYAIAFAQRNGIMVRDPKTGQVDIDWNHYDVRKAFDSKRAALEQHREEQNRVRGIEFENQRLREAQAQKQQAMRQEEFAATQTRKLNQLRPRAFEAMGLKHDDTAHRAQFERELADVIQFENAAEVTPELVTKAARRTKEALREREQGGKQQPKAKAQPFQPQLGGGGGKIAGNQSQERWYPEKFFEERLRRR